MVNILYVITKLELGGAQRHLVSLIAHLDTEKFRVFLCTAHEGMLLEDAERIPQITIYRSRYLERAINPFKDIPAFFEIVRLIRKHKIDIVHTHSSKAGIIGRLAAGYAGVTNVVHTVHGWSFNDCQPGWVPWFFLWMEKLAARRTKRIIVVSESDRQKGIRSRIAQEPRFTHIPYGVDMEGCSRAEAQGLKKELGIAAGEQVVVDISCLKPQKAPEDFVRVAHAVALRHARARFILVGDGVLRPRVTALRARLGLQDTLILAGWRRDIPRILTAADILVLTSLWEGDPLVVHEAMRCGIPVVATNTGGVAETVEEGVTGFLVAPHDVHGMTDKIGVLLEDDALRTRMGSCARSRRLATAQEMCARTQEIYESL